MQTCLNIYHMWNDLSGPDMVGVHKTGEIWEAAVIDHITKNAIKAIVHP